MNTINKQFAIIFVGFPGIGKTTVGNILINVVSDDKTKFVYIDQDMCKSNAQEYINQIDYHLNNGYSLILGKNHHNTKMLKDVYLTLKKYSVFYKVFNFVPDLEMETVTDILIERIRNRLGHQNLSIKSEKNSQGLEEQEVRKIVNGFFKSYEKPNNFIQLDFMETPDNIAYNIYEYLRSNNLVNSNKNKDDFSSVNWKELKSIKLMELPKKKLYYAFTVSNEDHDKIVNTVKEVATNKNIDITQYKFHDKFHITAVFLGNGITNNSIETINKWCEENENKEFKITLKYIANSKKLLCIPVDIEDGMCQNQCPHITVALTPNTRPVESNKVLELGDYEYLDYTSELVIKAKLEVY
jgi:DNA polymerase III delta prime subunit